MKDLDDLPDEIMKHIEFIPVKNMDEVIDAALER